MTFENQISTDAETALTDLRDKVSGMSNWGIVDDSALAADGGYVVFNTPSSIDEQVMVDAAHVQTGPESNTDTYRDHLLVIQTGRNWDGANWGTQGGTARAVYDHDKYDEYPHSNSPGDAVEYWLGYVAGKGFYWYVRRVVGDGDDIAYGGGYALVETDFWNYHGAETSSGYAGDGIISSVCSDQDTSTQKYTQEGNGQEIGTVYGGTGLLNPDANFTNYMWDAQVLQHSPTQNSETSFNARCARAYPVWLNDRSGSDINSGDVVQDADANDEYMILNYHGARATISME